MQQEFEKIWNTLQKHEARLRSTHTEEIFNKMFKKKMQRQRNAYSGVHLALCVDTRDPWKQNRVRYFSPITDLPPDGITQFGTLINQCDWAWPISSMGGIDDSGLSWVPPPGSTLCLIFQNDSPKTAFYLGTTWQRNRGPENATNWGVSIPEYDKIFKGHRKGYMVGKNDESQCLPPNNTDNYQGYDFDSSVDTDLVIGANINTTWPHVYQMRTPEKHGIVMDDGDPKCNRRFKRLQIMSSMGALFLMKDDPYNNCGAWLNPKCKISFVDIIPEVCLVSYISYSNIDFPSISQVAVPYVCVQGPDNCPTISETPSTTVEEEYLGVENFCPAPDPMSYVTVSTVPADCWGVIKGMTDFCFRFNNEGKNKYHKHKQECFPYLEDRCGLPQSGVQILARSGATLCFDDSVEEPRDRPEWERALVPFDKDGCTGVFRGRTFLRSATGHYIELNDEEINSKIRGPKNGITLGTACGQIISLNDHSLPGCVAGSNRGVHIKSSTDHTLDMVDDGNQQCSPVRDGCAKTGAFSKKAFVRLRSGYGIEVLLNDGQDQTKTDKQYLRLLAPQKDNLTRGPHMLHMQESATGAGQVFLRSGGDYVVYSYDHMVEVVGSEENPSNKLEFVSNMKVVSVQDIYYNKARSHVFWSSGEIFLLAGKDCADGGPDAEGTCVYPVVVACQPIPEYVTYTTGMKASERVFASAIKSPADPCEGIASES